MYKPIDPLDVKKAIIDKQLEVYISGDRIYLKDVKSGDTAQIGEVKEKQNENNS